MANLRELDLSSTPVDPRRVLAALDSPNFRNLKRVFLYGRGIDEATFEGLRTRLGDFNQMTQRAWYE